MNDESTGAAALPAAAAAQDPWADSGRASKLDALTLSLLDRSWQ